MPFSPDVDAYKTDALPDCLVSYNVVRLRYLCEMTLIDNHFSGNKKQPNGGQNLLAFIISFVVVVLQFPIPEKQVKFWLNHPF